MQTVAILVLLRGVNLQLHARNLGTTNHLGSEMNPQMISEFNNSKDDLKVDVEIIYVCELFIESHVRNMSVQDF